jgi:hypothetical protein
MHLWHHVKGVPGRLVGHPEQGAERRFIGKQKKDPATCAKLRAEGADFADIFDDVEELVKAEGHERVRLDRAIARGDLVRLAKPVTAHSHAAAMAKLEAKPAKQSKATAPAGDAKSDQPAAPAAADVQPATSATARKGS